MTDLELRWNRAASGANYAGSEYHNNPELVFERVKEMQRTRHEALMENVSLRRRLRDLEQTILELRDNSHS